MWHSRDSTKRRIYCLPVVGLVRNGISESQGSALRDNQNNVIITQQTFVDYLLGTKHHAWIDSFNSNHTLMRRVLFFLSLITSWKNWGSDNVTCPKSHLHRLLGDFTMGASLTWLLPTESSLTDCWWKQNQPPGNYNTVTASWVLEPMQRASQSTYKGCKKKIT